jgi:hypothetical protein
VTAARYKRNDMPASAAMTELFDAISIHVLAQIVPASAYSRHRGPRTVMARGKQARRRPSHTRNG